MTLGDRIKQARLLRGLTLEELGDLLGVTRQLVHQWQKGESDPRKHIGDLCKALQMPPEYFHGQAPAPDALEAKMKRLSQAQRAVVEAAIDAMLAQQPPHPKARSVK